MSQKIIVLLSILFFTSTLIQTTDCVFVSVGDYPNYENYREYGINRPECGLRYLPIPHVINRSSNCFGNNPGNITVGVPHEYPLIPDILGERIAFGENAGYGEAPYTVFLQIGQDNLILSLCTGILVAMDWVITAAHCFDEVDSYEINTAYIDAGSNSKTGLQRRTVFSNDWFIHENYSYVYFNGTHNVTDHLYRNDLAILKLEEPFIKISSNRQYLINTICLPNGIDINIVRESATFFGFGRITEDERATHLQKGLVDLEPFHCPSAYLMYCGNTIGNLAKLCSGDSGGPLLQYLDNTFRAVLVGVNRGTYPKNVTCPNSDISFWVSVSVHIDWILSTISEHKSNK